MTQRIFDIENEEDMKLLWSILPDWADKITKRKKENEYDIIRNIVFDAGHRCLLNINWHDATEITRPVQDATEQDIGKLCVFWNDSSRMYYGILAYIGFSREMPYYAMNDDSGSTFDHCRRLTKQEIEELI